MEKTHWTTKSPVHGEILTPGPFKAVVDLAGFFFHQLAALGAGFGKLDSPAEWLIVYLVPQRGLTHKRAIEFMDKPGGKRRFQ
ncbi:MAG TPA: hypothetical protein VK731_09345 [Candidatus Cybelea sp.]|nr:hypothetical protein [Candidatus Cybelea sp.]